MLLRWTETKLWTLKHGSKSIQTSLILRQRPPKPYKLLKFFISFVTTVKSRHAPTIWKKPRWKSLCRPILKSITEITKKILRVVVSVYRLVKIWNSPQFPVEFRNGYGNGLDIQVFCVSRLLLPSSKLKASCMWSRDDIFNGISWCQAFECWLSWCTRCLVLILMSTCKCF